MAHDPEQIEVDAIQPLRLYDFDQRVLFSPAVRGEGFIKLSVTTGKKGARSTPHSHPRDEVTLTLSGEAVLRANGKKFFMKPGTALRLPPGCMHEVEVLSDEWTVVAAYCDECQLCRPLKTPTP